VTDFHSSPSTLAVLSALDAVLQAAVLALLATRGDNASPSGMLDEQADRIAHLATLLRHKLDAYREAIRRYNDRQCELPF
jgi:hypothetical protein